MVRKGGNEEFPYVCEETIETADEKYDCHICHVTEKDAEECTHKIDDYE